MWGLRLLSQTRRQYCRHAVTHRLLLLTLLLPRCLASNNQGIIFRDDNTGSDACRTRDGGVGECREISSCASVMATFKKVRPVSCGFRGLTPIVCCPLEPSRRGKAGPPRPPSTLQPTLLVPPAVDFECGRREGVGRPRVRGEIVGGKEAMPNSWPWMAAVGRVERKGRVTWFCTGVLVTPEFVLSAAHCVARSSVDFVSLGRHNLKTRATDQENVRVVQAVMHPLYSPPSIAHDLALLQLDKPQLLTPKVSPVCLPWAEEDTPVLDGRSLTLAGWGSTSFGRGMSDVLREVELTAFPNTRCNASYSRLGDYRFRFPKGFTSDFLCVGVWLGGRDACKGDSGAPLLYNAFGKYMLAGVVSAGLRCGLAGFPGVYAAVRPHLQWIREVAFSHYV